MRRPLHANPSAPHMSVLVFGANSKKAILEAQGTDPSHIAKTVSEQPAIGPLERNHVREKVRIACQAMQKRIIPNLTDMQLEIGSRRIRIKEIA